MDIVMRIKLQIQDNLTGRRAVIVHNLQHINWLITERNYLSEI